MKRRVKTVVRVAAYSVYLTVAVVVGLEVVLRVLELAPTDGAFTVSQSEFERLPGLFSPDRSFVETRIPQLPHRVSIDSLGYRGTEDFPRRRPDGELRIVITGDSFTWGDHVDDDETLPALLERELAQVCPRVRVINAGIPSTTVRSHTQMILRALDVEPQIAVVMFQDGDLVELLDGDMWSELAENRAAKSRFPLSVAYPLLRSTAIWNKALELRTRLLMRRMPLVTAKVRDPASVSARENEAKPIYLEHLTALRDSLRKLEVPLVVAAYPGSDALHDDAAAAVGTWAVETARERGLPAVNLRQPLAASGLSDDELYLYPYDGHPSPEGYRLAAAALADTLRTLTVARVACPD